MKKFLFVFAGVGLGSAIFAAGAFVLLWLISDNGLQIDLRNDSTESRPAANW